VSRPTVPVPHAPLVRHLCIYQRPQPRIGADDVVATELDVQRGVDGVQQETDLLRSRLGDIRYRSRRILVRQAEIHAAQLLRHREHEAVELSWYGNGQRS